MLPNIKNDANPFLLLKPGTRVVSHCPNNEIVIFWILRYEGSGFMSLNKIKLLNSPDHIQNLAHLSSPGHQLLMTRFGPLDLLGTIGAGHSYGDLLQHSDEIKIGNLRLRVLSLEKLIEVKEETGFEKDKAILPVLRQTLLERRKGRQQKS